MVIAMLSFTFLQGAPYVISPWPSEQTESEGLPLLLDCPVRPLQSIFGFEWYWNTFRVRAVGRIRQLDNGTLYFPAADRVDSGLYYCKAYIPGKALDGPIVNVTIACE